MSDKELKKYKARIFGDSYSIVSDEDDAFVLDVVHKVDHLMKNIAAKHTMIDVKKIAVLAAIQATEDMLRMQQEVEEQQHHSDKIISMLRNSEYSS